MKSLILFVVALTLISIWGVLLPARLWPRENTPQYCYFVIDELGNEHQSEFAPYFGDYGIYWDTDEEWGIATSPIGVQVDKDCLRAKGVDVDAIVDHGYPLP